MRALYFIIFLSFFTFSVEADFIPPREDAVPLRIDQIPLNAATIKKVSDNLLDIVNPEWLKDAEGLRLSAQALALSLALNPEQERGARVIEKIKNEENFKALSVEERKAKIERLRKIAGSLKSNFSLDDPGQLSIYLSDILNQIDPEGNRVTALEKEAGNWMFWVEPISEFKKVKMVENTSEKPVEETPEKTIDKEEKEKVTLKNNNYNVNTYLWVRADLDAQVEYKPIQIQVVAKKAEQNYRVEFWSSPQRSRSVDISDSRLNPFLTKRGELPGHGLHLTVRLPGKNLLDYPRSKDELGPLFYLIIDAAYRETLPKALILGKLDENGQLVASGYMWENLRMISNLPPQKIIVPRSADWLLDYLLTIDHAETFMKYDIFYADDIMEALSMANDEWTEEQKKAREIFNQIRESRGTRSLGSYVATDTIRKQLADIVGLFPGYASAVVLTKRSTPHWPQALGTKDYAREIRACLAEIGRTNLTRINLDKLNLDDYSPAYDLSKKQLLAVERLNASISDRNTIFKPANQEANSFSNLLYSIRKKQKDPLTKYQLLEEISSYYKKYKESMNVLTEIVGDSESYPEFR